MIYDLKLEFTAQRHAELLNAAKQMLSIIELDKNNPKLRLLECNPKYACFITLDYSVSALEAFIAHLRYIFAENPDEAGEKTPNFFRMLKEVKERMEIEKKTLPYIIAAEEIYPFYGFREAREARNAIHHVRPQEHNVAMYERKGDKCVFLRS